MFRLFFIISLLLLVSACSHNPVTKQKQLSLISEKREIMIGSKHFIPQQQLYGGLYLSDFSLQQYVHEIGHAIAVVSDRPKLPYEFVVVNSSVPNAWSLPGGKIAITRGLLVQLESEEELAAVLSHEVVHAAARHSAQHMERNFLLSAGLLGMTSPFNNSDKYDLIVGVIGAGANAFAIQYNRKFELEADKYGMIYMYRANFNPEAAISLQDKFISLSDNQSKSWLDGLLSTHPPSVKRKEANIETLKSLPQKDYLPTYTYEERAHHVKKTQKAYDYLEQGYMALQNNDSENAIVLASKAASIEPNESHFYLLKGKAYARLDKDSQALQAFDQAIALNNFYFDNFLQRGLLRLHLGNISGAKKDLELSLYLLPTAEAHHALGLIKFNSNLTKEAVEHFRKAAEIDSHGGRLAKDILKEIETPALRNKDIQVTPTLTSNGYIVIEVHNKGRITLKNVIVDVDQFDPQGNLLYRNHIRVGQDLKPNQVFKQKTAIGPFYGIAHLEKSTAIHPVYSEIEGLE